MNRFAFNACVFFWFIRCLIFLECTKGHFYICVRLIGCLFLLFNVEACDCRLSEAFPNGFAFLFNIYGQFLPQNAVCSLSDTFGVNRDESVTCNRLIVCLIDFISLNTTCVLAATRLVQTPMGNEMDASKALLPLAVMSWFCI